MGTVLHCIQCDTQPSHTQLTRLAAHHSSFVPGAQATSELQTLESGSSINLVPPSSSILSYPSSHLFPVDTSTHTRHSHTRSPARPSWSTSRIFMAVPYPFHGGTQQHGSREARKKMRPLSGGAMRSFSFGDYEREDELVHSGTVMCVYVYVVCVCICVCVCCGLGWE